MIKTDVLIVGGGPAGSSCAWQLNRAGIDSLILDKARFPRQKPCAGWITPDVFKHLDISPEEYPYNLTKFSSFQVSLRGIRFQLPTKQYAIRRWEFDNWMIERPGVKYLTHKVEHIEEQDNFYIVDGAYQGKFLIGAGGTHCPVQKTFFNQNKPSMVDSLIVAKEEEFLYDVKDHRCHLWFFEDGLPGYAWYVPKSDGNVNVGIGGSIQRLRKQGKTLQQHWQRLIHKLESTGLIEGHEYKPLGYSYFRRYSDPELRRNNIFLVGDALGLATRDMGEGICPAIQSGMLVGKAIASGKVYSIQSIPNYSFPSIFQLRKK